VGYRLTRKAAADLRHIFVQGMTRFGLAQADRYHARLRHAFELLAENPGMARERAELTPPARVHPCGVHIILYLVEAGGMVLIVRVRHGREDWLGRE
jgi:toxin ParE1/3/4